MSISHLFKASTDRSGYDIYCKDITASTVNAADLETTGDLVIAGDLNVDAGALFVDASANQVGINKLVPAAPLDVVGNTDILGNLDVTGNIDASGNLNVNDVLWVNGTNTRVGVNQLAPTRNLDVVGTGKFTGAIFLGAAETELITPTNSKIFFTAGSNQGLVLTGTELQCASVLLNMVSNSITAADDVGCESVTANAIVQGGTLTSTGDVGATGVVSGAEVRTSIEDVAQVVAITNPVSSSSQITRVTTQAATALPSATDSFVFTNSLITSTSTIVSAKMVLYNGIYGTAGIPIVQVSQIHTPTPGACNIGITNAGTNALSGTCVIEIRIWA